MPHVIRLRGAWDVTPETSSGRTRHARNFGRPRTLDPGERLWLVCDRVPGPGVVSVNGEVVGTVVVPGPVATDITDRLHVRNTVLFTVLSPEPLGDVRLEVRGTDTALALA